MEAAPAKPEYEPSRQPKRKPAVRTVSSKKSELSTLLVENEDLNLEIEQSINLSAIQETAMKKYGMKKPAQRKVIAYESKNVDYVRQYNKVPDSK